MPPQDPTANTSDPEFPTLLQPGIGPDHFPAFKVEFNRLYLTPTVHDVLGRRILFGRDSAHHVCYKPQGKDPYYKKPREVWSQERAERIPWISRALTAPTEIRPNSQVSRRQSYLLRVPPLEGRPAEFYFVAVDVGGEPGKGQFLTAYPCGLDYWNAARRAGKRIYPA